MVKLDSSQIHQLTAAGDEFLFEMAKRGVLSSLSDPGAIVYRHQLPTSTNAPLVIAGNTVIVAAGGPLTGPPLTAKSGGGKPQIVAYTVR